MEGLGSSRHIQITEVPRQVCTAVVSLQDRKPLLLLLLNQADAALPGNPEQEGHARFFLFSLLTLSNLLF